MKVTAIAAMASNRIIGNYNNSIPWKLSTDFKHFKANTLGKVLIMGRKTYYSIPVQLKNRHVIVLSRDWCLTEGLRPKEYKAHSIDDAIEFARKLIVNHDLPDEIMICGGGTIYEQTKHLWTDMMITDVHMGYMTPRLGVKFPEVNYALWEWVWDQKYIADDKNEYDFTIQHYRKIDPTHMKIVTQ